MNNDDKTMELPFAQKAHIEKDVKNYKNEHTYLAAYSIIKQVQAEGETDIEILNRLNNCCAKAMGVRPIPL